MPKLTAAYEPAAMPLCRYAAMALLAEEDSEPWLGGTVGIGLLKPAAARSPVSKRVNSSKAPANNETSIDRRAEHFSAPDVYTPSSGIRGSACGSV